MGSNPIRVAKSMIYIIDFIKYRGLSSAGRASALQAEGHRFEPYRPHLLLDIIVILSFERSDKLRLSVVVNIPPTGFCRHGSMAEQLICNQ